MTTILSFLLSSAALIPLGQEPAHPAPEFCIEQGGISSIYVGPDGGQIGLCRLKDNSIIEEITFWNQAAMQQSTKAASVFLESSWHTESGEQKTWADQNCEKAGGKTVIYFENLRPTSSVNLCVFDDNSSIESWTLFAGPTYYPSLEAQLGSSAEE